MDKGEGEGVGVGQGLGELEDMPLGDIHHLKGGARDLGMDFYPFSLGEMNCPHVSSFFVSWFMFVYRV